MAEYQTTTIMPTKASERVEFVDILRGFALFGILVANMASYSGRSTDPASWNEWLDMSIVNAIRFLIEAKFYSLFSFLFGWGMAVQMIRAQAKERPFILLYLRRLTLLLLIGIIHGILIWFGDILTTYALLGFILLLFRHRSPRFLLLGVSLCLLLSMILTLPGSAIESFRQWYADLISPFNSNNYSATLYSTGSYAEITQRRIQEYLGIQSNLLYYFGNVFSMFLLGLYVGKQRLFQNIEQHLPLVRRVAIITFLIGILGNGLFVYYNNSTLVPSIYSRFARVSSRTIGAPSLMLFYVSALILLLQTERGRQWLNPLANVGRLALTNYLSQSLIATLIFYNYGLGLYGLVDPTFGLILTIIIYLAQIHFSRWWLEQYQFGPVEWLWRSLTYGRRQPLQRGQALTDLPPLLSRRGKIVMTVFLILALLISVTIWFNNRQENNTEQPFISPLATATINLTTGNQQPATPSTPTPIPPPAINSITYNPSLLIASGNLPALVQTWDFDQAMHHIETLAGPEYGGRLAGSPGGQAAADYIAAHFAEYGLQPAGDNGTFFQSFPITYTELTAVPELNVIAGENIVPQIHFQDYTAAIFSYAGPGSGRGQVIWLDDCQPDDFAGQNLVGKIPFCQNIVAGADITTVSRTALEYGATGLLLLTDPSQWPPNFGNIYRQTWVSHPIPTFRVYPNLAQDLLLGSSTTITNLLNSDDPLLLTTEVQLSLTAPKATIHEARNVLGVIPGRDPAYSHEVVIIGGHFDHLGQAPDGTLWAGANDNASGIAALLEIARSWHEQGYVPRRTVLFAAWDGEEHGLFGSTYYVQHPRYPLANTQAAIQLDMVGAGIDTLSISSGPLANELQLAAESLGVESAVINLGRSDHVPFLEAGIPATLIIWADENVNLPHYHRPLDLPHVIEPAKLTAAAQVAETTLLTLADSEPAIHNMLASRAQAINSNDLAAFLTTVHPDLHLSESRWFTDLQQLAPQQVDLQATAIDVQGDKAALTLNLSLIVADETHTTPVQARLSRTPSGWQWHGPNVIPQTIGDITIAYPPEVTTVLTPTAHLIQAHLNDITALLGLPPTAESTLLLLPDSGTLRATTALSLPPDQTTWVESGLVKLVYSPQISTSQQLTDTLAQLILANAGLSQSDAPWLWHGLPLLLREQANPDAVQKQLLPALQIALATDDLTPQPALDWSAVAYLQQYLGWRGLGEFIQSAGHNGVEMALQTAVSTTDFPTLWQQDWRNRLTAVQNSLDRLMNDRVTAVNNDDLTAFLETLDPSVPNLGASESHWFQDAQQNNLSNFSLIAQPIAFLPNDNILADVTWQYSLNGDPAQQTGTLTRLFTPLADSLLWAGIPLETLPGVLLTMRYSSSQREIAETIQQEAESIYPQLAAQLQISNPLPLTIELIESAADLQQSIAPSFGSAPGWTASNSGLKLQTTPDYQSTLAIQLTRQLLHQIGVGEEWLLKGVSILLSRPFDKGQTQTAATAPLPALQMAAQNNALPDLFTLPDDDQLSATRLPLARAAAWDAVRFLVESYGWDSLLALLRDPTDATARAEMGVSLPAFELAWQESVAQGHIQPEWVEVSQQFDIETAVGHLNALTDAAFNGRLAGTDGSDQAAQYIADQFATYGLQPAGDDSSYFQQFPITHTELLFAPRLAFVITETAVTYTYRQDFLLSHPSLTGSVSGDLIWLQTPEAEGNLNGKIVLMPAPASLSDSLNQLAERGAAGLILPTFKREEVDLLGKRPILSADIAPIPIYELTQAGYTRFLEAIGQSHTDMDKLPSYHPLHLTVHLETPLSPPTLTTTANVLGLLPGSDPFLSQEVIIIGAHYDHVGNDPDTLLCPATPTGFPTANTCQRLPGLPYSGRNDNASGVAVLLALAQQWQETGYRPQRTLLFAAWGAQEMGQPGSTYFVMTPTQPLTHVIAMVQLDGVGGGDGFSLGAQGDSERDSLPLQAMNTAAALLDEKLLLTNQTAVSDQLPFREAGLPTLLVAWRLADENNLPDEAAFAVHEERLFVTGHLVSLALMSLAQ